MILGDHQAGHSRCVAFCQEPPANSPKQMGQAPFPQPTSVRTYTGERLVPQAKTLGLLVSLMFRRQAEAQGAYEAPPHKSKGRDYGRDQKQFPDSGGTDHSLPPQRRHPLGSHPPDLYKKPQRPGAISWDFRPLPLEKYQKHPGAFLTSTSVNVLPIGRWGGNNVDPYKCRAPSAPRDLSKLSPRLRKISQRVIFSLHHSSTFLPIKRSEKGIDQVWKT
jgi:hypothetical protein